MSKLTEFMLWSLAVVTIAALGYFSVVVWPALLAMDL